MTIFVDFVNSKCFILSPKCGTQTLSKYLKIPINISYEQSEILNILKDKSFKKIIVVRDVIDRFFSGFYEDLKHNDCYLDLNISFFDYIKFICYCHDNKIKNINNISIYYPDKNNSIYWGACSGLKLPVTDSSGKLSGHIISQKIHLSYCVDLLEPDDNVEIIDISELSKITNIQENVKHYTEEDKKYNYDTLISDLKKANIYPKKEYMLNNIITNIINHIYISDIIYIESIKNKFKNTVN